MAELQNYTFEELKIGQSASLKKTLTDHDVRLFAAVSGDVNPVHLDEDFAAGTMFKGRIGHGMWTGSLISAVLAMQLPGPGTIYLGQNLSFRAPVMLGDEIVVTVTVSELDTGKKHVLLACEASNQNGKTVAKGEARVMAPAEKMTIPAPPVPTFKPA